MAAKRKRERPPARRTGGNGGSGGRSRETAVSRRHPHAMDYSIVFLVVFLVGFGLVMIYSTSSYKGSLYMDDAAYWLKRQALFAGIGLVAMLFVGKMDYHFWKSRRWMINLLLLGNNRYSAFYSGVCGSFPRFQTMDFHWPHPFSAFRSRQGLGDFGASHLY